MNQSKSDSFGIKKHTADDSAFRSTPAGQATVLAVAANPALLAGGAVVVANAGVSGTGDGADVYANELEKRRDPEKRTLNAAVRSVPSSVAGSLAVGSHPSVQASRASGVAGAVANLAVITTLVGSQAISSMEAGAAGNVARAALPAVIARSAEVVKVRAGGAAGIDTG
jgi:hypothetical protein